ncbi:MAG: PilZ domain-containing protein, partial [Deltaproteobacteria bacterium]|nr:PilZ domain-containing protein [Deltaproteobacteria bacterium]
MLIPPPRPKRAHPRVPAGFMVKLEVGARQVLARARDLSMAGLFVDGPVSRQQFAVEQRGEGWFLTDLSGKGTDVA